ncbi:hypothetical protein K1719_030439 [Acacia pycnantha]|nr:hypothetical protein K1719_030439 [Acacia pycnantha]
MANGEYAPTIPSPNKACPKDAYPMPNIDRLVDNSSRLSTPSFMDAYSGYNQIAMHPDDQEATSFITEKEIAATTSCRSA